MGTRAGVICRTIEGRAGMSSAGRTIERRRETRRAQAAHAGLQVFGCKRRKRRAPAGRIARDRAAALATLRLGFGMHVHHPVIDARIMMILTLPVMLQRSCKAATGQGKIGLLRCVSCVQFGVFKRLAAMSELPDLTQIAPTLKAEILAEALPYIRQYHGKTVVIKYGGNAMTEERLKQGFARDVILLKLVGINPVIVHGGGLQIDQALKKIGKQGTFIQGMRVTDEETMEVVEWVLGGEVQQDIVTLINHFGGHAVGLTGKDGGFIHARKLMMPDRDNQGQFIDIGQVGEVEAINPAVVKALQDDAFIPVISPIGFGEDGLSYNINADLVAGKLAVVLNAEKLVMMTNIPGVMDKEGTLLTNLSAHEIDALFADGTISGGMLPKISSALDAAKSGVRSVHIIDGRIEHSVLLEILTEQPFGTMIRSH